jgi:diaminobutyrate-2-oxoglutarate transaminase
MVSWMNNRRTDPSALRALVGPVEVLRRLDRFSSSAALAEVLSEVRTQLRLQGIDFEGREVPVSLLPTLLEERDLARVARAGALVRSALLAVVDNFVAEHRAGDREGPLHHWYAPYRKWWDLIARERRRLPAIGLMRYDAVREVGGRWRVLETNTACPGGTITCAKARRAWLATALGRSLTEGLRLCSYPIDEPAGFVKFLAQTAQEVSQEKAPNIALCWCKGQYKNELAALQAEHRALVERGELPGGEIILCDIRDLTCDGGPAFAFGKPIALVHNKIDPLMVDPNDQEIAGWLRASRSLEVEFLNSLGAMYLTEAKRVLALLSDPDWWPVFGLDRAVTVAIEELVPFTRALPSAEQHGPEAAELLRLLEQGRHHFVLKADALTRGQGVHIGSQLTPEQWRQAIRSTAEHNGVLQVCASTPRRDGYRLRGEGLERGTDFYGVDLFYFGGSFAGPVSRSHSDMIFNVGNGGKESPTLVIP